MTFINLTSDVKRNSNALSTTEVSNTLSTRVSDTDPLSPRQEFSTFLIIIKTSQSCFPINHHSLRFRISYRSDEMAPVFSKPRHSQSNSQLCHLPAELRLIILRRLLYIPKPCGDKPARREKRNKHCPHKQCCPLEQEAHENITAGLKLSQSCQLLLEDGTHVLYNESVLQFNFFGTESPVLYPMSFQG